MKYSDKLNGYWEEGYHYYLEFRDEKLTVRNYRREISLETTVTYDADSLDEDKRTVISLSDNILSRTCTGEMMTEIKELAYENGELKFLHYYTIMGETLYTLKKTDKGPFDHIIIRDDEFIDKLQGRWENWSPSGKTDTPMIISGNSVEWFGGGGKFHVVSYSYDKNSVYLAPENLIDDNFSGFNKIQVFPDMLTTHLMIFDMSTPLSVFARADMLDKIEIPPAAREPARSTMIYEPHLFRPGLMSTEAMMDIQNQSSALFCQYCGHELPEKNVSFCPECGMKI